MESHKHYVLFVTHAYSKFLFAPARRRKLFQNVVYILKQCWVINPGLNHIVVGVKQSKLFAKGAAHLKINTPVENWIKFMSTYL